METIYRHVLEGDSIVCLGTHTWFCVSVVMGKKQSGKRWGKPSGGPLDGELGH